MRRVSVEDDGEVVVVAEMLETTEETMERSTVARNC